jgi:hypothetical protein
MSLLWVLAPCRLVDRYQRFGESWRWRQYVSPKRWYLAMSPHGVNPEEKSSSSPPWEHQISHCHVIRRAKDEIIPNINSSQAHLGPAILDEARSSSSVPTSVHYKDQLIRPDDMKGNNRCLFWESYGTHKYNVGKLRVINIKADGSYSYHCALKT